MKHLIFLLTLIAFVGCKNHSANIENLKLDNGNKWTVNTETQEGITKMGGFLKAFNGTTTEDYKNLGDTLSSQTSYIIKHCTMKGESHNQLHEVLLPMLDNISVLRESAQLEEQKKASKTLNALIKTYHEYFKL
ncbi:MAG: hypothetical protein ACK5MZ_09190 [Aestuariibaculum sp.]